jgi:hypothetical protein
MKRFVILVTLFLAITIFLGNSIAFSQATFKIPFKFYIEGKSYPPGDYWIAQQEEGKITLRKEPGGEDIHTPVIKKLAQSEPPIEEPLLVFDMVGNFEPSYTEYITDYLLAEVWLPGKDGFLVLSKERVEDRTNIKGAPGKK